MPVQGEAANGYKVYQANQAKKKAVTAKVVAAPGGPHPYEQGNEVAKGYANRDRAYIGVSTGNRDDALGLGPAGDYLHLPGHGAGGSGHGSGGGGPAVKPVFDASPYAFDGAPYDKLMAAMQSGLVTDQASAKGAYDTLDQHLAQLSDPYAHIQPAAAAQVDPSQLAALLQSQGGDSAGLRAQAQFLQAQNGSSAAASDRLAQMLSANQQGWNQSTQAIGQQSRADASTDLMAQFNAMKAALDAKKLAAQGQMSRDQALAQSAFNERNA